MEAHAFRIEKKLKASSATQASTLESTSKDKGSLEKTDQE